MTRGLLPVLILLGAVWPSEAAQGQSSTGATETATGWRVGVAPVAVVAQRGPQGAPPELGASGTLRAGAGLSFGIAHAIGAVPLAVQGRWSSHTHAGTGSQFTLAGRTHLAAGTLVTRSPAVLDGRLRIEAGGGALYSRSRTSISRVGQQLGLRGTPALVRVDEWAPMATATMLLHLVRSPRRELSLRAGVDYAWTDGSTTVLFPVGLQFAR